MDAPLESTTHEPPFRDALLSELELLQASHSALQSKSIAAEQNILSLSNGLQQESRDRDLLQTKLLQAELSAEDQEESFLRERLQLEIELEISKARVSELLDERTRRENTVSQILNPARQVHQCLARISETLGDGEKPERRFNEKLGSFDPLDALLSEMASVSNVATEMEEKLGKYEESRRKEKKELENSIVSLAEENKDIGNLLRVALVEKEAVEKSLNKLKGSGEQRRVAILQIAERGLQKVGFGFMMGAGTAAAESQSENQSASSASTKSDGSEGEEETVSLASTVEKIMRNLRLEIIDLKRSLEEARSDSERSQSLADKQSQKISEYMFYIKSLEERESMLVHNVEELTIEIREAEEEVARWREACELEVEAGKRTIQEREREITMLRDELERTKASLDVSNNKLQLKEKLAAAAMAAHAAAEASLRLADSRSAEFRERIEELTRQVEEEARRGRKERSGGSRKRVRNVCWPWKALRLTPTAASWRSEARGRRMLPEMDALLHFSV